MRTRSQGSPVAASSELPINDRNDKIQTRDGDTVASQPEDVSASRQLELGAQGGGQAQQQLDATSNESGLWTGTTAPAVPEAVGGSKLPPAGEVLERVFSDGMDIDPARRRHLPNPWSCSPLTLATTVIAALLAFVIGQAFLTRQLDPKGCAMSYMRPSFAKFSDFDTEHTRFASKYSLYLYRESGVDEDTRVKGIPVMFIPGNAGSYKQVRPFAAEAAVYFQENLSMDEVALANGKRALDWFSVDFNEDITAFHGQTLLDQAEYLNEAVAFILSLYHDPARSLRDSELPDPSSVLLMGHSMGGIVARTMLVMPNYQSNTINTIITLAAPHARAPVSFDAEIVRVYKRINDYWRSAYAQKWANDNPLWHVTLISIAGGGLDTIVPSDYSTLESLVPPTHGFTVFTSTIPHVWTSMDHLAITWCDQLRKSVTKALYDVTDAGRPGQTRPRSERMRAFKKRFLTGMEDVTEHVVGRKDAKTLLVVKDDHDAIMSQGERLVLRSLGKASKSGTYLLPIPPQASADGKRFTLLTDQSIDTPGEHGALEVLFCSLYPQVSGAFPNTIDLSGDSVGSTRLACSTASSDVISLPASTRDSQHPFDEAKPFSYLQFALNDLAEQQFVAVIDKSVEPTSGFVIAEFTSLSDSVVSRNNKLPEILMNGLTIRVGPGRPMMTEITIPSIHSSLLAYKLAISEDASNNTDQLFMPLLRQSISEPYESKFFVNVKEVEVSLHGIAPYIPPSMKPKKEIDGLYLQFWIDPTFNNTIEITLEIDYLGSAGKLWMRYRSVFAAFPLLVVALVLRKQFTTYDNTGIFISFSESMDKCIRRSIPCLFLALTVLAVAYAKASSEPYDPTSLSKGNSSTEAAIDFTKNDLLLGSQDTFFSFLLPLLGIISIGICISLNYVVLALTHVFALAYTRVTRLVSNQAEIRIANTFAPVSFRKRFTTTIILLLLASTVIPYQFEFVVLCIVHFYTCFRSLVLARETKHEVNLNRYNYVHSIFILMLWILPINLPILIVWARNLAVHWLTPFTSYNNVLSILPFVLLVETLSAGKMVPRVTTSSRHVTNILLFCLALYAAVYGVTYAYRLHTIVNIFCAWLGVVHMSGKRFSPFGVSRDGAERSAVSKADGVDAGVGRAKVREHP